MGIRLRTVPRFQVLDLNGEPLSGGKVYTYQPGTSTAKATYTDYTGGTENANPVILNSRGEATIYWDGTYKVIVKDANDVTIYTEDNYGEGEDAVLQGNFNLVLNGSFEQDTNGDGDPDDWTVVEYTGGTVALDSTDQIHGTYSLKFTSVGTGGGYSTSDYFEVQGSRVYPVSFAIVSSVATVHNKVDIIWYTAAQAVISTTTLYDDTSTNPTSWTDKSYTTTAPATARFARVRVFGCVDDDAQTGSTWYDNVQVESPTTLHGWFSGVNGAVTATDEELSLLTGKVSLGELASATTTTSGTVFDVDAAIAAAWESVGPTGSGATNIWSALDVVPSGAGWVEVQIENEVSNTAGDQAVQALYANAAGVGGGIGSSNIISLTNVQAVGVPSINSKTIVTRKIPVDSSRRLELYRNAANGTSFLCHLYLVGWG